MSVYACVLLGVCVCVPAQAPGPDPKRNAATIMREGARLKSQEMEEAKRYATQTRVSDSAAHCAALIHTCISQRTSSARSDIFVTHLHPTVRPNIL